MMVALVGCVTLNCSAYRVRVHYMRITQTAVALATCVLSRSATCTSQVQDSYHHCCGVSQGPASTDECSERPCCLCSLVIGCVVSEHTACVICGSQLLCILHG